jgi:TPR repeat protein
MGTAVLFLLAHTVPLSRAAASRYEDLIETGGAGLRDGQAGLGQLLAYGWGEPTVAPEAAYALFSAAAADMTHERACAGLGQCYTYGWGVRKDYSKALRYYRCAASGYYGDPLAQYEIGQM